MVYPFCINVLKIHCFMMTEIINCSKLVFYENVLWHFMGIMQLALFLLFEVTALMVAFIICIMSAILNNT